jgi:NAD(P)-dependent dehydrogenase (short-subunit alcohol dehydrogenase family)
VANISSLDYLVIVAAQTIRSREKSSSQDLDEPNVNRYGDPKYSSVEEKNSWQLEIDQIDQFEMEEVFRINSIAPLIIISECVETMKKSNTRPFIINVHSREGLMSVKKSTKHVHLNMAKSALSMLTYNLKFYKYKTHKNESFSIHGIDPGWISIDEYYESDLPWVVPPIDEIDGASKIVYPIFANLTSNFATTRHYKQTVW